MSDQRSPPACPHCARRDVTIRYLERRIEHLRQEQQRAIARARVDARRGWSRRLRAER